MVLNGTFINEETVVEEISEAISYINHYLEDVDTTQDNILFTGLSIAAGRMVDDLEMIEHIAKDTVEKIYKQTQGQQAAEDRKAVQ